MGDSLKRAVLATLCSRGPWATTDAKGDGRELTADQVCAFYAAIPDVSAMGRAVDCEKMTHRPADRAATLLKRAGLIRYNKVARQWERL